MPPSPTERELEPGVSQYWGIEPKPIAPGGPTAPVIHSPRPTDGLPSLATLAVLQSYGLPLEELALDDLE